MRIALLCLCVVLSTGCGALTDIDGSWTNPEYSNRPLTKLAVFCVGAKSFISGATVESAVVKALANEGVVATPASSMSQGGAYDADNDGRIDPEYSKEAIAAKLREVGFDGVLVVSVKDMKSTERYVEGSTIYQPDAYYGRSGWYNYWSTSYVAVQTPGYTTTDITAIAEANLYALDRDLLAWGAQTSTFNPTSLQEAADSFAAAIVPAIVNSGVVKSTITK